MNSLVAVFQAVKRIFASVYGTTLFILWCAGAIFIFFMFLKLIVEPVAPIFTLMLALVLTLATFTRWQTALLALFGITVYLSSWPATHAWGLLLGLTIWLVGFMTWVGAVYMTFSPPRCLKRAVA